MAPGDDQIDGATRFAARVALDTAKNKGACSAPLRKVAEWTGLEPATPGVTGRYSNQLNYHSATFTETNNLAAVVPAETNPRVLLVGAEGIEPPTLAL